MRITREQLAWPDRPGQAAAEHTLESMHTVHSPTAPGSSCATAPFVVLASESAQTQDNFVPTQMDIFIYVDYMFSKNNSLV